MNPAPRSSLIAPLNSVRFLAALHLYLFHLNAMRGFMADRPGNGPFQAFQELPSWFTTWVERGYCSTSLFFLLSGFVLAYLYLDRDGRPTVGSRAFWWARFTRIYPLHIVLLVLLAPLAIVFVQQMPQPRMFGQPVAAEAFLAVGFVLSATLTQAWFPDFALTWNFPTWALSAVVFFYWVFPWLARRLASLTRRQQQWLLALLPLVSLLPPAIFLALGGDNLPPPPGTTPDPWKTFSSELIMRTPLFWLPHFVMGILVARLSGITRHPDVEASTAAKGPAGHWSSWGDLAWMVLLVVTITPDDVYARVTGIPAAKIPLLLRHGTLAPLYWVLVRDLALGRGLAARVLSWSWLARLGNTSFSIFMLQLPMISLGVGLGAFVPLGSIAQLVLLVVVTVGVASGCAALERWATNKLRGRSSAVVHAGN